MSQQAFDLSVLAVILTVALFCIVASCCAAVGTALALRRDKRRAAAATLRAKYAAQQRKAWADIERQFADIRQEHGVDRHGRLKPLRCSPREAIAALPYSRGNVTDLRDYAIRHQAG